MTGRRIRDVRHQRGLSLRQLAGAAGISVATLSRIETEKQDLAVELFISLAGLLDRPPAELLDPGTSELTPPSIHTLKLDERMELWRTLESSARTRSDRKSSLQALQSEVEEILAHLDLLRAEIERIRDRLTARR